MTVEVTGCGNCPFGIEINRDEITKMVCVRLSEVVIKHQWFEAVEVLIKKKETFPENCPLRNNPITIQLKH